MRLSVAVNSISRFIASLSGPGYLNAHLNLKNRSNEKLSSPVLRVVAIDTSQETENETLEWEPVQLEVGDVVEMRILPEGSGDAPSKRRKSSESPTNLLSQRDLAEEVVTLIANFDKQLVELMKRAKEREPAEEYEKFSLAVANVIHGNGALLYPIFRRHKELIPDEFKGELL